MLLLELTLVTSYKRIIIKNANYMHNTKVTHISIPLNKQIVSFCSLKYINWIGNDQPTIVGVRSILVKKVFQKPYEYSGVQIVFLLPNHW